MTTEQTFWLLGDLYSIKQSEPDLVIVEIKTFPGNGPPPHIHHREDESFYILEGTYEIHRESAGSMETVIGNPGDFFHIPKGTLHTYRSIGTEPSRVLVMLAPGGLQRMWQQLGQPASEHKEPSPATEESIKELLAIAPSFSLEIPPPRMEEISYRPR
jgi:mannose-6-phosphate isomerase-like protein (cupin superfamily)